MTTLPAVLARYMRGEATVTETVASPAWGASSAEDVTAAVIPYLSRDGGLAAIVELWRKAPELAAPARRLAQRIVLSPHIDELARQALAAVWLSAPDATVASLLRDHADIEYAWELAIVQWGQGQIDDETVELLDLLPEPTMVRTVTAATAIGLWRLRQRLLRSKTPDDVVAAVRELRDVNPTGLSPSLRPALHRIWVLAAEQATALAVAWPTTTTKHNRAALQFLGRTDPWTAGTLRKELRACRKALLGERPKTVRPRRPDLGSELRSLSVAERSERVKQLWAAGGQLPFPVVTAGGRQTLVDQLNAQRARLKDVRLHKNDSYNASGDQWHDNPGFLALEQEENGLVADIARRRAELRRAVEISLEPRPVDHVSIGSLVDFRPFAASATTPTTILHCEIVGLGEADGRLARVSYLSPLAIALRGASVGSHVTAETPDGELAYEVVALQDSVPV